MAYESPDLSDPHHVIALFRGAAEAFRDCPLRRGNTIHLPDHGRLTATGDLHDNALNFQRLLKFSQLGETDDAGQTVDQHLVLHEVIHGPPTFSGMDFSIRMIARCADLKLRYPSHFHSLLSNHELAQLRNEGITKEGISVCDVFDQGIENLYAQAAEDIREAFDEYVQSLPLAIKCANGVMLSHSLPAPRRIEAFDKTVLDRESTEQDTAPKGSAYDMVWGRHQNKKITDELAEAWGVRAFVVGHQPAEMGCEPVADNTLIIASDHNHGVALPIDLSCSYTRDELMDAVVPLAGVLL
ncbi:hypothetical protein [Algisphaera agarilytica]|uniref:Calcineurin-like phosphoesterase domain-containing protein n=1 Tax=Algisphaera agarilytica TaxID=1385975 RepID=A0A7X0H6V3_9BACT|nr:hypothetical protein [Algisphaera agarilytica]MBB6430147.1 hypothetical protein [Algisphaera agarilytica]